MSRTCVVIVSYKGSADTAACLQSLADSDTSTTAVVVDTTPYDPEVELVVARFPNTHLIQADANLGFGGGNNLGIRWALLHTSCEYLFLLNNDALVFPRTIGELEAQMSVRSDAAILTPRIAFRDRPDRLWYGGGDVDWRRASVFTPGFDGPIDAPEALRERWVTFASGCALFVRRSVMISLGGFDSRFFMYEEDVEWCLRAQKHGCKILYVPKTLILHRAQGSSNPAEGEDRADFWSPKNPRLPFYAFHIIRNRMLNVYTHANARQKFLVAIFFPLYLLRHGIPFLLGGRPDAVWAMFKGIFDSWKHRHPEPAQISSQEI